VKINNYGQVEVTEQEAFEALYTSVNTLEGVVVDCENVINQYNSARQLNADRIPTLNKLEATEDTIEQFDKRNQSNWFMPDNYCPDLIQQLYSMCATDEQRDRVSLELELFVQHSMLDLLYYLKYLVDTMRDNKIMWGVGRGSSVASYVLFLLGVHKIDSIKYELDIHEFLK
jgi:DNA polymerase III alpha subunit